jgi:hypothetical protein
MSGTLFVIVALALGAVLVVLVMGFLNLSRGDTERSQRLMRWRIGLQFLALALILLLILVSQ